MLSSKLISIFLTSDDPSKLLPATQELLQFIASEGIEVVLTKVSENLGDNQAPLRKASHQFFANYIKTHQTFQPVIQAMLKVGLSNQNVRFHISYLLLLKWVIRQKNLNSLQSLIISEWKLIEWDMPELDVLVDVLLKKIVDTHLHVSKAAEQTLISLIKLEHFKPFYAQLPLINQQALLRFVESQKLTNGIPESFSFEINTATITFGQKENNKVQMIKRDSPICPPLDQQDFDDLKDTQWQIRAESIQNIQEQLDGKILLQLDQEQLSYLLDEIIVCVSDHNFKVVIVALDIILKVVKLHDLKNENHMFQLVTRLTDPKQAIRAQISLIFNEYLTKTQNDRLLSEIVTNLPKRGNNGKEEVLDLISDLCNKNKKLLENNLQKIIKEVCPLMEDNKAKLKMKTIDTLVNLSVLVNLVESRQLIQNSLNRVYFEMYNEKLQLNLKSQKGFGGANLQDAVKSWNPPSQQQAEIMFHTPPRLSANAKPQPRQESSYESYATQNNQNQKYYGNQNVELSTASSSRSELPQSTLANRLKNKGEMLASKNQAKNQNTQDVYIPSAITKMENKISTKPQNQLNMPSDEETFYQPQTSQAPYREPKNNFSNHSSNTKRITNSTQSFDDVEQFNDSSKPKSIGKPFRITKNQTYQKNDEDEEQQQKNKVTYTKPFTKKTQIKETQNDLYIQPVYLTQQELTQIDNVDQVAKTLLAELRQDDWQRQFEAMNNCRKMIKFHPEIIKKIGVHQVILEVVKNIDNLRSGLAKNSLLTVQEASLVFKKEFDQDLEPAIQRLVKKSCDTNSFIAEEVRKCMETLVKNCNENKCVNLLNSIFQNKSVPVRINIAYTLRALMIKISENDQSTQESMINFEKLFQLNCAYVIDQSEQVRNVAKESYFQLLEYYEKEELNKLIQKEKESKKLRQILDKGQESTSADFKQLNMTNKATQQRFNKTPDPNVDSKISSTRTGFSTNEKFKSTIKSFQPKLKDPPEFESLQQYLTMAENNDWKSRIQAANWMFELGNSHPNHLCQHKFCNKYLDIYIKLINDSNVKVGIQGCSNFIQLIPLLKVQTRLIKFKSIKVGISNNASNVWNGTFLALSSNNQQIRQSAEQIFQALSEDLDVNYIISHIAHGRFFFVYFLMKKGIQYGPAKSKVPAINLLSEYVAHFYEENSKLLVKHVMPLVQKLSDESKLEMKQAVTKLIVTLDEVCEQELRAQIPSQKLIPFLK